MFIYKKNRTYVYSLIPFLTKQDYLQTKQPTNLKHRNAKKERKNKQTIVGTDRKNQKYTSWKGVCPIRNRGKGLIYKAQSPGGIVLICLRRLVLKLPHKCPKIKGKKKRGNWKRKQPYWLLTQEELISPLNFSSADKLWSGFRIWSVTMATGWWRDGGEQRCRWLEREYKDRKRPEISRRRSRPLQNFPAKFKSSRGVIWRYFSKYPSQNIFVPGPVKSFSKFFFSSLFIKIDAFKPTSKRFVALWQGSALRIFSFFCLLSI